jgi:hypothetical protein
VSHPRAGTRLHPSKGFLTRLKLHGQPEGLPLRCSLNHNLQLLLPCISVPPKEVCPFYAQQSFGCHTSLPGLQQQAGPEVSEHCSRFSTFRKSIPNNYLTQIISHGPDNLPIQSHSQDDRYTKRNGYRYGLGMVVGRYEDSSRNDGMYLGYWFFGRRKNGKILNNSSTPLFPPQWSIPPKELSLNNKYACLQLDTCHVGRYSDTLVPYFRT